MSISPSIIISWTWITNFLSKIYKLNFNVFLSIVKLRFVISSGNFNEISDCCSMLGLVYSYWSKLFIVISDFLLKLLSIRVNVSTFFLNEMKSFFSCFRWDVGVSIILYFYFTLVLYFKLDLFIDFFYGVLLI